MPSTDKPVALPSSTTALSTQQAANLTAALLSSNSIPRIQSALQHSLQESGWTHNLRAYLLNLLRSGECATYDDLMARVLDDTRQRPKDDDADAKGDGERDGQNGYANGTRVGADGSAASIKIPDKAVREGIRAVRKEVEAVCEITFD